MDNKHRATLFRHVRVPCFVNFSTIGLICNGIWLFWPFPTIWAKTSYFWRFWVFSLSDYQVKMKKSNKMLRLSRNVENSMEYDYYHAFLPFPTIWAKTSYFWRFWVFPSNDYQVKKLKKIKFSKSFHFWKKVIKYCSFPT